MIYGSRTRGARTVSWGWILALLLWAGTASAEKGVLILHVKDVKDRPMAGVQIGTEGDGAIGPPSDRAGKTRVRIAPQTQPGHRVTLQIVASPPKTDLVFISPWDRTAQVPPFENESNNYVPIVLAARADQDLLKDPKGLRAIAANINRGSGPERPSVSTPGTETGEDRRQKALQEVAQYYGFPVEGIDAAIREWGKRTKDPYDAGLAALYERDYPVATKQLTDSFELRKKEEAQARIAVSRAREAAADAAFFLGRSLYSQGRYSEAVMSYREAFSRRPDDPRVLNVLALSLFQTADYAGAEPLFRRALAMREKALGPDHPDVAISLNNLASLLNAKGDYAGVEPLFRRALAIREKALGPDHPDVANSLNNLADLLRAKGDYAGAEPLFRRALAINEKALGPDHPDVATSLNNLAGLLRAKGDYAGAEPLFRRALAINEKALGPDHPDVANSLNNLAGLLRAKGDYAEAEPLFRRALAIDETALGPDHPNTQIIRKNLEQLSGDKERGR